LEAGFEYKQIKISCSVLSEPADQLLKPMIGEPPFFSECFSKGVLRQMSSETYGVIFSGQDRFTQKKTDDIIAVLYEGNACNKMLGTVGKGYAAVMLRRGDVITSSGITKTFRV
jgi:hypothetical protein